MLLESYGSHLPTSPSQPAPWALLRDQQGLFLLPAKRHPFSPGKERQTWCQRLIAPTAVSGVAIKESQGYMSPAGLPQPFGSEIANWWPMGWIQLQKYFVWSLHCILKFGFVAKRFCIKISRAFAFKINFDIWTLWVKKKFHWLTFVWPHVAVLHRICTLWKRAGIWVAQTTLRLLHPIMVYVASEYLSSQPLPSEHCKPGKMIWSGGSLQNSKIS